MPNTSEARKGNGLDENALTAPDGGETITRDRDFEEAVAHALDVQERETERIQKRIDQLVERFSILARAEADRQEKEEAARCAALSPRELAEEEAARCAARLETADQETVGLYTRHYIDAQRDADAAIRSENDQRRAERKQARRRKLIKSAALSALSATAYGGIIALAVKAARPKTVRGRALHAVIRYLNK